jgi:hypothetical protein
MLYTEGNRDTGRRKHPSTKKYGIIIGIRLLNVSFEGMEYRNMECISKSEGYNLLPDRDIISDGPTPLFPVENSAEPLEFIVIL